MSNAMMQFNQVIASIAKLESDLVSLKDRAKVLWKQVGAELGMSVADTDNTQAPIGIPEIEPDKAPTTKPSGRSGNGYARTIKAVKSIGQARLRDVSDHLESVGHPIAQQTIRSYLNRGVDRGDLARVDGTPGLFMPTGRAPRKPTPVVAAATKERSPRSHSRKPGRSSAVCDATRRILTDAGNPLHLKVIQEGLVAAGVQFGGKNPYATLSATLRSYADEFENIGHNTFRLKSKVEDRELPLSEEVRNAEEES